MKHLSGKGFIDLMVMLLLTGLFSLEAHAGSIGTWAKTYGAGGQSDYTVQTFDGGSLLVGSSNAVVLKLDALGNILWQRIYEQNNRVTIYSVQETRDHGFIMAGEIVLTHADGYTNTDAVVLKLNENGAVQWRKIYGASGPGTPYAQSLNDSIRSIREAADGGFIAAGSSDSFSNNALTELWIMKLDATGAVEWQKAYDGGFGWYDYGQDVRQAPDGGYFVLGSTSTAYGHHSYVWLIKFDSSGSVNWTKSYGSATSDVGVTGYFLEQTDDGGVVVAGMGDAFSERGNTDIVIMKMDAGGSILWQAKYGGGYDIIKSFAKTPDGGFLVAGTTTSFGSGGKGFLFKLDASGTAVWQKLISGPSYIYYFSAAPAADGGYFGAAYATFSFVAKTILFKFDDLGTIAGCAAGLVTDIAAPAVPINASVYSFTMAPRTADIPSVDSSTTPVDLQLAPDGFCAATLPPVADAGPDQSVNESTLVTLDGSGSSDPARKTLTFAWTQVSGPAVDLNLADPAHPALLAPAVSPGGATLTFQLVVSNGESTSKPDLVNVTIKNVNHPPVAEAGDDRTVAENGQVTLDGSFSYDPDADSLTYAWIQTAGPAVYLSGPASVQPAFTAPLVGAEGAMLSFQLTVNDGLESATDTVNIFVENVNHAPVANAGQNQTRNEGSLVVLNGTASSDPDGDRLSYAWSQVSGPLVILSDNSTATPNFTAPGVGLEGATLVFQLLVNDGSAESAPAQVTVMVLNVNSPPACERAQPGVPSLWPPNHKLVPVSIMGVSDSDNDRVTLTILEVSQDEPVDGLGDGDAGPDGILQGSSLLLRAERAGNGNGRTYHILFKADDGSGESCTGTISVTVPHDRQTPAVDDGALFNSLR